MQLELFAGLLTVLALIFIIGLIINALFLGVALGFTKGQNRELSTTFVTALGMAIVTAFIPFIGCVIAWWLIKTRHGLGWGGAIVTWIILIIIEGIVLGILFFLFPFLFAGIFSMFIPVFP